jgi:YD repeat-containing protein
MHKHRIVKQTTANGETWRFAYRRTGACVVKLTGQALPAKVWDFTCCAGQSLSSAGLTGTCPDTDSDDSRAAGWRSYGCSTTRPKFKTRGLIADDTDELGQWPQYSCDPENNLTATADALGQSPHSIGNVLAGPLWPSRPPYNPPHPRSVAVHAK